VNGKKEKVFKGTLSPCDKIIEKDSFISRLTDLITPSPKGIEFQRLEKDSKFVYIFDIEQSFYAPHQFRNIYYMRIDGQTKAAPHHYIEALFKKITYPKLEGYIKVNSFKIFGNNYILNFTYFIFNMSKLQNEHEIYYRISVTAGRFQNYNIPSQNGEIYAQDGHELRVLNAKSTLYYNEPLTDSVNIIINPHNLVNLKYECKILFAFGGKQSPLMYSYYVLLLKDFDTVDKNSYFSQIDENKYFYEMGGDLNLTETEKMKNILGR
jgi:hypothetical protein